MEGLNEVWPDGERLKGDDTAVAKNDGGGHLGKGLETLNEDTTSFTGCGLTSWAGGDYWAGAGLLLEEVTEEGWRRVEVKALKAR